MPNDDLMDPGAVRERLAGLPGWQHDDNWLVRTWKTDGWRGSMLIVGAISFLAEAADHHPDLEVHWGSVVVRLQTHTAGGVTARDLDLAGEIEQLVSRKF
jgi:4a-hydroxytetrahydrobiopterin dehydratase